MDYRDFTLESACRTFALALDHRVDLHAEIEKIAVGEQLRSILEENVTLATSIHTEVDRTEYDLDRLEKILAILLYCVRKPVSTGAPGL